MNTGSLIGLLWRLRWLLLALGMPLWLLVVAGAASVGVDNGVHVWFVEGDPALDSYDDFQEAFGNDEVAVFLVQDEGGILSPRGLARLRQATAAAEATPGVARVLSLANVTRVAQGVAQEPDEAPPLRIGQALDGETDSADLLADPLLSGRLISADGRSALVMAWMAEHENMDGVRDGILEELYRRVEVAAGPTPRAGIGVIFSALNLASSRDVALLGGASYLLVFGLLWVFFGRPGPVLVALVAVGSSALVPLGLMGWAGVDMNTVTMVLPTLVFIIGVADAVHLLNALGREPLGPHRVRRAVSAVFWPCVFTSLTTAAGFLSLASARVPVVRQLGLFATAGVLAALGITVLLVLIAGRWPFFAPGSQEGSAARRVLGGVGRFAVRYPRQIVAVGIALTLGFSWAVTWVVPDTFSIDYFREDNRVRLDSDRIERTFGPSTPLEFVVEVPDGARDPEVLAAIAAWQDAMEGDRDVGWSRSVADVPRRMNQLLTDGEPASRRVPQDAAALEQLLWLYEADAGDDLPDLVDPDWTKVRVTVGLRMMSATHIGEALERLTALAQLPAGARIVPSGYLPLYVTMMDYVVRAQVSSFAIASVLIFGLLAVMLRSVRLSLLAVPPNLLPVVVSLGLMGALGIRLDVATVTIAALVLGLVVDDTTHFLFRYREEVRAGRSPEEAVARTLDSAGVAMLVTTVVLVLGFSILAIATVRSVAYFGLLVAVAAGTALVADVLLLPALLVLVRPRL
ncbi:MAG: MMPL family transporter [Deltaproteobacteria bacterium]|nr:MMPL family transporter [Deltaproteobacteria bacterium]